MKAPAFWALSKPNFTALALSPFGALYGAITARRMHQGGTRVAVPVICVGNFVVGGGGKTPAAAAIARLLIDMGERVAFVSRGYGGVAGMKALAVDPQADAAAQVGDEPLLLASIAPCFVGQDRTIAAQAAIRGGASVIVMDDGLQNPALVKDLSLAMVDAVAGLGNGLCVPAGPLRAPLTAQLPHVAAIVLVGELQAALNVGDKPVLTARLVPDAEIARGLAGRNVLAFAGIARPEKFYATLREIGANVVATCSFGDHHDFSPSEIATLQARAAAQNLILATTQKDAARLSPEQRRAVTALPVTLKFDDAAKVAGLLREALALRRGDKSL
jgi:tetraacyldisaccharide 4'-kinase